MASANLEIALKCAGAGVPVCPCDAVSGQRLEVDGRQISATMDAETIRSFVDKYPEAVFAAVTGRGVGLLQIRCVDNKSHAAFGGLRYQCGGKENTMSLSSVHGGRLFIYAIPKGSSLTGNVELDTGVTVCAEDDLVMLPTDNSSWALKDGAVEMPPKLLARCVEAMSQDDITDDGAREIENSPADGNILIEESADNVSDFADGDNVYDVAPPSFEELRQNNGANVAEHGEYFSEDCEPSLEYHHGRCLLFYLPRKEVLYDRESALLPGSVVESVSQSRY